MAVDADAYFPFASGAGQIATVAQWEDYAADLLRDGVILGAANEHAVLADSTGMQVKVPTGRVCIRGHRGVLTSQKTLGISANASGNTRIDRVVARLDVTNSKIVYDVLAGTPSGAPVAPALTQTSTTWELALAQVAVPPSDTTIDSGQVTDERTFAFPLGGKNVGDAYVSFRTTVANSAEVFLQGQIVSRVTYAGLFALWGTTYGAGDGTTTFKLPDMQGRVPVGRNSADATFASLGLQGGEKAHQLNTTEMPNHDHANHTGDDTPLHVHQFSAAAGLGGSWWGYATASADPGADPIRYISWIPPGPGNGGGVTSTTNTTGTIETEFDTTGGPTFGHRHSITAHGGDAPHNNLQPYLVVNYAIRAR
jgi:microcystin-dependent protein